MKYFNDVIIAREGSSVASILSRFLANLNDKTSLLIIVLFSLLCFIPGIFSISAVEREETNFVIKSQKMMEDQNYLIVQETGSKKSGLKIGTHWLHVLSAKVIGSDLKSPIWVYRLPSLFGAIFAGLALFWCVRAFTGPPIALLAALLTLSTVLVGIASRLSNSDALVLSFVVVAHGALARIWLSERKQKTFWNVVIFWVAISGSMLVGGPFGPMITILTIFGLSFAKREINWIRRIKPIQGLIMSLVVTIPWIVISNLETDGGISFNSVLRDTFGRLGHGLDIDGTLPLAQLLMMLLTFWPLSVFLILAVPTIIRNRKMPIFVFFLAWAIPSWIVLELISLKLPNFMLPILPAIATITAISLINLENNWQIGKWIAAILMMIIPITYIALLVGLQIYLDEELPLFGVLICSFGFLFAIFSCYQILRKYNALSVFLTVCIVAVFFNVGFLGVSIPSYSSFKLNELISKKITEVTNCSNPRVGSVNYQNTGLSFYVKMHLNFSSIDSLTIWLSQPGCKIALIEENQMVNFQESNKNYFKKPIKKAELNGFNYNNGKKLKFLIYQSNANETFLLF